MTKKPSYEELNKRVQELESAKFENKRAAEELKAHNKLMEVLLDNLNVGVFVVEAPSGKPLLANQFALDTLGRGIVDGSDKDNLAEIYQAYKLGTEDYYPADEMPITRGLQGQKHAVDDMVVVHPDGKKVLLEVFGSPVRNHDGQVIASLVSFSDITERRRSDVALQQSEQKYKTLADNINIGIYRNTVGPKGQFIETNLALVSMFGFDSKAEFLKVNVSDLYSNPDDRNEYSKKLLKQGEVKNEELRLRKKDGTSFIGSVSAVAVKDKSGKVKYYDGIIEDITERKHIEEAVRKSEERFRNVYKTAPLAFVIWDKNTRVIDWNRKAEEIFKWSKQEVVGKSFFDFIIPETDRSNVDDVVSNLLKSGQASHAINKNLTKDGKIITCEWNNSVLHDDEGAILGVMSLGLDITKRIKAEQDLRESERNYRSIYRNAHVGLARTRIEDGKVLSCNEKMANIFGYDTVDQFASEYLFSDNYVDPEKRKKLLKQVGQTGVLNNIEAEFYKKDKSKIWVRFDTQIFPDKGYMEDVVVDITENRMVEEALRKSEAKYRSMMESMVDPIYICSPGFTIEYMNPMMIKRIGGDATGERCYQVLHGLDQKCDWCAFDEVFRGQTTERTVVSPLDDRTYRITNMPILNEDGTTSKMTLFRDITDYLVAVSEKEKVKTQLLQAQKMESIGNLAGGIAHDFNNILSSIIGYTELALIDVEKGTGLAEKLKQVYSAGERARDLVKQILAFARQSEEETKPIQINTIVKDVLKFIRSSIPTTIEISSSIESDAIIRGNPTQVHQILLNLCSNAADAMENEGGVLTVTLKEVQHQYGDDIDGIDLSPGQYIRIGVADTGEGIKKDIIDSIFEPYYTTKEPGKGTGMGLALVHGIVESYGGKITVESKLGRGSLFSIYLPVTRERITQYSYESGENPKGDERILFVDDEAMIADVGSELLQRLGYAVTATNSSLEALELFRAKPDDFDLIITDMTMPNMSGDKLAAKIIEINSSIPIILCTGYSHNIGENRAKEIGIKAFAYKPIVMADLANTVRKVLDDAKKSSVHE